MLDADGRRVDSIPLPGMGAANIDPATLAKRLRTAKTAPAIESVRATLEGSDGCIAKVRRDVAALDGVTSVDFTAGVLSIKGRAGSLQPKKLVRLAKGHVVELTFQEPVRVNFDSTGDASPRGPAAAIAKVAGAWYVEQGPALQAYVTRPLLSPKELARAGGSYAPDVEARRFELPGIPKGGAGCRVALAPLRVPGVLAIFADLFHDRQTVVGRKGTVSWADVTKAFEGAGCRAKPQG